MNDRLLDDPTIPLLGYVNHDVPRSGWRNYFKDLCTWKSWRRRVPILKWLPTYKLVFLLQDAIAGITVGLTSIPQGIAYALIAGLPPQWGLYSSMLPGFMYMIFGSCKDVVVGPTAILAVLVSKFVAFNSDFAILAAFLSGCIIALLGLLNLGFLLDFVSKPVINGFTTAAALQIAASQFKPLFRLSGSSGSTFVEAVINVVKNIKTIQPWDPILGFTTITLLVLFKKFSGINESFAWKMLVRARNAIAVAFGATVAYCLFNYGHVQPFALTGKIEGGLPEFRLPPFSTVVNNRTLNFSDMLSTFGVEGLVMPLVAILESIAIAKAFAGSVSVDASQEMLAVGACNVLCAVCPTMPVTGSFTRTALNHHSGVVTPAGGLFKGILVLLSVGFLAPAFSWIPRATLAGVIIVAMVSIISIDSIPILWKHSKLELCVWAVTCVVGSTAGLEYGIVCGAVADFLRVARAAAAPKLPHLTLIVGGRQCLLVTLPSNLSYCCADFVTNLVRKCASERDVLVLKGKYLDSIDIGVAENLIGVILDLEKKGNKVILWMFSENIQSLLECIQPDLKDKFTNNSNIDAIILAI